MPAAAATLGNSLHASPLRDGARTHSVLELSVLVLNRSFVAVHVVNVRRAISLLFRQLAEVVHVEQGQYASYSLENWRELSQLQAELRAHELAHGKADDHVLQDWVRAIGYELQAPRVIRLTNCDRMPRQGLRFNRRNVFARDGNRCQYCGERFPLSELSLDHVVPRSRGGTATWENIVCACVACNVRKGGRTPQEARMDLIRQPVRPKRSPLLALKLGNPRYESWKNFVDRAYWLVDLSEQVS
ncbi:MAG: HNH endonuclease [Pirellulales bacterium]|jgi:5-methylcytosine-specific restriction endonuclease McrA|nr:HNH endonuclease [Pirellulales bacterium]